MKSAFLISILFLFLMNTTIKSQSPKEFAEIWDKQHISNIFPSDVRHKDVQKYLEKLKGLGLKVEEVGRSYGNREIYQVEWGTGKFLLDWHMPTEAHLVGVIVKSLRICLPFFGDPFLIVLLSL